ATINEKFFHDHNQFTIELDMVTDTKYVKGEKKDVPPRVEEKGTEIKMTIDSLTAFVNGESKTLDAAPIIRNSRTMLPVRFVAENLGATVGWDDATKTVTIKNDATTIEIVIGSNIAKVNGANIALDSPAFIENSRTYLPVRVVAENLGATVGWDDATKTATLSK
ncbi:MAG: copper amine oxidase N-terminal domain-containing protein, partial [Clostridia bacterium]|nr:copper amine oxidase N-terminal domain-containing protein [Clostridia bacterium]